MGRPARRGTPGPGFSKLESARIALAVQSPRRATEEPLRRAEIKDAADRRDPLYERCLRYGIRPDDYRALLKAQHGVCGACQNPETVDDIFVVDHNHTTGAVRGIIHNSCNSVAGFAHDSPARCRAVADYLERELVRDLT